MSTYFILWLLAWLLLFCYAKWRKYTQSSSSSAIESIKTIPPPSTSNAYELYSQWAHKKNEKPISSSQFNQLQNTMGTINLAHVLQLHETLNVEIYQAVQVPTNETSLAQYTPKVEQTETKKLRDDKLVTSAIVGHVTDSALLGKLIGGSWLGGIIGSSLKNNPENAK